MGTESFKLSVNAKDFIKNLKQLEEIFDFSNVSENHELLRNRNEKKLKNSN